MPTNDPSQLTTIIVLVGIIMICVILCIVKIQSEVKDMNENLKDKLNKIENDLHKIAEQSKSNEK